jgi:hypothetical protein
MKRFLPYLKRMWATDVALTMLLAFLLIFIFVLFPMGQIKYIRFLTNIVFSFILVTGAIAATKSRILRRLVFLWGILAFVFIWVRHLFPHQAFVFGTTSLSLAFLLLLAFLILGQAFREGPTTSHRIMGAVAVYLLLGLIWSLAYQLITLCAPNAFIIQGPTTPGDISSLESHLFYFSFVTLTTLGYGDIVAVHPMARMLVILEGVTGQLFPVILIARLVSLHLETKHKK